MKSLKIKDDVLGIISRLEVVDNVARITDGQLYRKLYVAFNEVLEAIGGKWNRKLKGHVFTEDPANQIESVLLTGEVSRPKDFDYFPTPAFVAEMLIEICDFHDREVTLEPSAGEGAIAKLIPYLAAPSTLIELDQKRAERLKGKFPGLNVECADFMAWDSNGLMFDRVVMNPPFSKQQDIDHVMRAWSFLKPGGRLVSVMSAGVQFRENKKTVEFRNFVAKNAGFVEQIEDGAFKESGTMVRTVIVCVDKPVA